jgi:phenylacetate-CoA ligase
MLLDYGCNKTRDNALSAKPLTILEFEARSALASITEIDMIENGDPEARHYWQAKQLENLLHHACARSAFWKRRILSRKITAGVLKFMAPLSRADLMRQVTEEGPLMQAPSSEKQMTYYSSGSTGTPVKIYVMPQNARYNGLRSLAQSFMQRSDFRLNRVQIQILDGEQTLQGKSISVERADSWLGPLAPIFESGHNKNIRYVFDRPDALADELLKDPTGMLVCPGGHLDNLLSFGGVDFLKRSGVRQWIQFADGKDAERDDMLHSVGITTSASYSSAEVGPIGFECARVPGHYHVAHSNVLVEIDRSDAVAFGSHQLGRILVTHLHSYASPIIRYDIGDMGLLLARCPCGHEGAVLTEVHGRRKMFLNHPDGRLLKFYFVAKVFRDIVEFSEISFRQTDPQRILLQLKRDNALTEDEERRLRELLSHWIDPVFHIEVQIVRDIDWRCNRKRLLFINEVV